ncbi:hypothetical protein BDR26DRAFT_868810 [Obelidium mucronatum]|nr:hypothetical protein BDR26DRAFT_868810 [Obelidium mucronatum]
MQFILRRSLSSLSAAQTAALAAFSARSGVALATPAALQTALTHCSYHSDDAHEETGADARDNSAHALLGARLLAFHTTQRLMRQFPRLPAPAVDSLVAAFVGDAALASVGATLGVAHALVGALYAEKGAAAVADFIKKHIESRSVNVAAHLNLHKNPKQLLRRILKEQRRPPAVSRMLKETGRLSTNPVFIVGVYSGIEKLGEGYGSSIKMAETRAFKNALELHFTKEVVTDFNVPLDLLSPESVASLLPGI